MKTKFLLISSLLVIISLILILSCRKDFAINNVDEAGRALNTIYPKKVENHYDLVIRYESKDGPEVWKDFKWKQHNNFLEKKGLLKQVIMDTTVEYYVHDQARFENRHQFLYKVILSPKIKSLMSENQFRMKKFDEYDYYNRKTGRKDWINCKAICGLFKVEKISDIQQKDPYSTLIKFYEKYFPTAFNDIIISDKKHHAGETKYLTIIAKRYEGEECRLIE